METDGSFSIQNAHFNADSESKTNATIYVNEVNRNKFVIYKPQKKKQTATGTNRNESVHQRKWFRHD